METDTLCRETVKTKGLCLILCYWSESYQPERTAILFILLDFISLLLLDHNLCFGVTGFSTWAVMPAESDSQEGHLMKASNSSLWGKERNQTILQAQKGNKC